MDAAFLLDRSTLARAIDLLERHAQPRPPMPGEDGPSPDDPCPPTWPSTWPSTWPESGLGDAPTLDRLASAVLGGARRLGDAAAFAHMDPPTPCIAWATTMWNASLNQNLLHPDTAPVAREIEARVVSWLAPFFGMDGGHMVPGSTVANLTAIWAARELAGVREVVASAASHLSVRKAAHLLGLAYREVPTDDLGRLRRDDVGDLSQACLVSTAGTTSTGAIDPLQADGPAAWLHVDAAWAGPLRFSPRHAACLAGIERADSVAVSAHKWLFQPKESALVLFRDAARAHAAISFGGAYLAAPNVGVLGSHGAAAVPLLATLLSWGRQGVAERIDRCMDLADRFSQALARMPGVERSPRSASGIVLWRHAGCDAATLQRRLPPGAVSTTLIDGQAWLRNVAANPNADPSALADMIERAVANLSSPGG